jgi:hypothetical protein
MHFGIFYVVYLVASVAANSAERSLEEQSQTFQDDEEFELFYDVLKEISENGKAEEPDQEEPSSEGITTRPMEPEEGDTSTAASATEVAAAVPALPMEEEEEDILEDSVEEVISHYEGGLVQIIRQAERAQEENEKQFVGVAVGGGVAGVMLLGLTALAGLFFLRQRRSRRRSSSKEGKQSSEQPCDYSPVANAV